MRRKYSDILSSLHAHNERLSISRETIRVLTSQDLGLIAAGEISLVFTQKEPQKVLQIC